MRLDKLPYRDKPMELRGLPTLYGGEGYWLTASSGTWAWERFRMSSPVTALACARMIVEDFKALGNGG